MLSNSVLFELIPKTSKRITYFVCKEHVILVSSIILLFVIWCFTETTKINFFLRKSKINDFIIIIIIIHLKCLWFKINVFVLLHLIHNTRPIHIEYISTLNLCAILMLNTVHWSVPFLPTRFKQILIINFSYDGGGWHIPDSIYLIHTHHAYILYYNIMYIIEREPTVSNIILGYTLHVLYYAKNIEKYKPLSLQHWIYIYKWSTASGTPYIYQHLYS